VERFVIQQNIEHYRALLDITTDLERRGVFEKLLLEEEARNTMTTTKRNNA